MICADCEAPFDGLPGEPCGGCGSLNIVIDPEEIPVYYDDESYEA